MLATCFRYHCRWLPKSRYYIISPIMICYLTGSRLQMREF